MFKKKEYLLKKQKRSQQFWVKIGSNFLMKKKLFTVGILEFCLSSFQKVPQICLYLKGATYLVTSSDAKFK